MNIDKYKNTAIFFIISIIIWIIYIIINSIWELFFPVYFVSFLIKLLSWIGWSFFLASLLTLTVEKFNIQSSKELYQKEISKLSLAFLNLFLEKSWKKLFIYDKEFSNRLIDIAWNSSYRENYTVTIENISSDWYINFYVKHKVNNLLDIDDTDKKFKIMFDPKKEDIKVNEIKIIKSDWHIIYETEDKNEIKKLTSKEDKTIVIVKPYTIKWSDYVNVEYNLDYKSLVINSKIIDFNSPRITKNLEIKIKKDIEKNYTSEFTNFHNLTKKEMTSSWWYNIYKYDWYLLPYQGFDIKFIEKRKSKKT